MVAAGVLIPASPASAVPQTFVATMVATQEVPSNASPATGAATVVLNAAETQITVNASFTGLQSNSVAGHIHANPPPASAQPGTNAPVLFNFGAGWIGSPNGTIGPLVFAVTPGQVLQLRTGQMYVNIHSILLGGGEIRGQLVTSASYPATAAGVGLTTTWNLRNALTTGPATNTFAYGTRPNVPLICDLNGDGNETPVSYEAGAFKVRHSNSAGLPDTTITFGDPRGFPVAGDFDGDALDDLAVYRNGTWNVRYTDDNATDTFSFGPPGGSWPATIPVTGDWNGDGIDGIATYTYSTATWSIRGTATAGGPQATFVYGTPNSSYPVVGDWDLDNDETVGVRAGTTWSLRNNNSGGAADITFDFGLANTLPLSWRGAAP